MIYQFNLRLRKYMTIGRLVLWWKYSIILALRSVANKKIRETLLYLEKMYKIKKY